MAEQEAGSAQKIADQSLLIADMETKLENVEENRMEIFRRHSARLSEIGEGVCKWVAAKFGSLEKLETGLAAKLKRYFRDVVETEVCTALDNPEEERWMVILGLAAPKEAEPAPAWDYRAEII